MAMEDRRRLFWQPAAMWWVCMLSSFGLYAVLFGGLRGYDFKLSDTAIDCIALLILLIATSVLLGRFGRVSASVAAVISVGWMLILTAQMQFLAISGGFATSSLIRYSILNASDVALVAAVGMAPTVVALLSVTAFGVFGIAAMSPHRIEAKAPWLLKATNLGALFISAIVVIYPSTSGAIVGPFIANTGASELPWVDRQALVPYSFTVHGSSSTKPDIVFWILESTRHDVAKTETVMPFVHDLSLKSLRFPLTYTTTTHTSKSLFGIFCGRAPTTNMRIMEADADRPSQCLPRALSSLGYRTVFIQTALGSFENRKNLASNVGFETAITREDLGTSHKTAGFWAMDERAAIPVAVEAARKHDGKPLLLAFLTSTSHAPYAMPGSVEPEKDWPQAYLDVLRHVDRSLEQMFREIGKVTDLNNTILVVVGDHGEAFGEHGPQQHDQVPFEEGVRVPLFIHYPENLQPGLDFGLRQTVDLVPTLLDLINADWSGSLPGKSLLGPGHSEVVTSCWETRTCHSYVRSDGMKVIFRFGEAPESVFDLRTDAQERNDLAASNLELIEQAKVSISRSRAIADIIY